MFTERFDLQRIGSLKPNYTSLFNDTEIKDFATLKLPQIINSGVASKTADPSANQLKIRFYTAVVLQTSSETLLLLLLKKRCFLWQPLQALNHSLNTVGESTYVSVGVFYGSQHWVAVSRFKFKTSNDSQSTVSQKRSTGECDTSASECIAEF